jgi:hypothetical protein
MKRAWFILLLVLISTQSIFASITITSSQVQVEASGMINPSMLITGATPWDFHSQSYGSLTGIDEISVTLTLLDGDTAAPLVDVNDIGELMLQLDGLNTGLALNGFPPDVTVTHTVTGPNQAAGLLAALQIDGFLLGSVLDLSPNDNYVKVVGGYGATLSLTDYEASVVPVPSALLLGSLGVAATAGLKRKRLLRA